MRSLPSLPVALALVLAACGGNATSASTTLAPTSTSVPSVPTTLPEPATTTTTIGASPTTMAGREIDFGPGEGDVLMVIGVRYDDVLNLRAAPGADQAIRDRIPPTFDELVAEGNTRELPSSLWVEIAYEGSTGWVHLGYVGYEGDIVDETADVIAELGETPVEPTMSALGRRVADLYTSEDPESDVVQVTGSTSGDLHEVTYDVIGLGDDSVRGVRLHLFAEKTSAGLTLKTVEMTIICGRGVDPAGACV